MLPHDQATGPVPEFPRLTGCAILDRDLIRITCAEGEVVFAEDEPGFVPDYTDRTVASDNRVVWFGALDTARAALAASWTLERLDGPAADALAGAGHPLAVFRKTTIAGMAQLAWSDELGDYHYETPLEHTLYLRLAAPLEQGGRYRLVADPALLGRALVAELAVDWFAQVSEAIHVNLCGQPGPAAGALRDRTGGGGAVAGQLPAGLPADVYHWLGDGGFRDYSPLEGAAVWLVHRRTGWRRPVGALAWGADRGREGAERLLPRVAGSQVGAGVAAADPAGTAGPLAGALGLASQLELAGPDPARSFQGYDQTGSPVWRADAVAVPWAELPAVTAVTAGTPPDAGAAGADWCLAVEGIGCSQPFALGPGRYKAPFDTSLRGFYYMRIGEPVRPDIRPVPRQPRWIPRQDPPDTRILLTTMHPWHPEWSSFAPGDKWDPAQCWKPYVKPGQPENTQAVGGHADALDWDRHLGHVSIIYDLLLPFLLTGGACADDDTGIAESGNGIPDLLDEARNEVDFWLSLRDGPGYAHGLTNPDRDHVFYQAAPTAMAAWANAANAAWLADCCRLAATGPAAAAGPAAADRERLAGLSRRYLEAALTAWQHAGSLAEAQLDQQQWVGDTAMRGRDFRLTAAASLYNLTGDPAFEAVIAADLQARDGRSDPCARMADQTWATAAVLCCPRPFSQPGLLPAVRQAVLAHGLAQAGLSRHRPSRRTSSPDTGHFHTAQNVHRILLAHACCPPGPERQLLLDALLLEAGWGLGRNPLNMVQMTTASSSLEQLRGVRNAYTSGRRDGSPGLHPGHTPYLNTDDWGKGLIMSRPRWMGERCWPAFDSWPQGERCFNTRWVWAHTEFTPQQTMRGKMALYGYLHGLGL